MAGKRTTKPKNRTTKPKKRIPKSNKKEQLKKALLEALRQTLGIVTPACEMAGCGRTTFYKYLQEDAEFAKQVKDMEEIAGDFVESQLFKQIKEGEVSSTIFYAKTKLKERGYVERQERVHQGIDKIEIVYEPPKNV